MSDQTTRLDHEGASVPISPTVSFQTCIFILFALAINCMTQPGGRVCGLPLHSSMYLRSSPLICAVDALALVIQLILYPWYKRTPFRAVVQRLVRDRFETQDLKDVELRRTLSETGLRWIFFALSGVFPALKLAAYTGLPWTKAWGMMYFVSWIVGEGFIVCSSAATRLTQEEELPFVEREGSAPTIALPVGFGVLTLWTHAGFILWTCFQFWPTRDMSVVAGDRARLWFWAEAQISFVALFLALLIWPLWLVLCHRCYSKLGGDPRSIIWFTIFLIWLSLLGPTTSFFFEGVPRSWVYIDWLLLSAIPALPLTLGFLTLMFRELYPNLAANLSLTASYPKEPRSVTGQSDATVEHSLSEENQDSAQDEHEDSLSEAPGNPSAVELVEIPPNASGDMSTERHGEPLREEQRDILQEEPRDSVLGESGNSTSKQNEQSTQDDGPCFAFVFFIINVCIPTVWYWRVYDATGTHSRTWTAVFGR